MSTTTPIDYSKFKIEVYSSDGVLIKTARINQAYDFYCDGLVPGQEYDIIFSYDDILLIIANFICDSVGKVVYLNPAHFLFNNALCTISAKAGSELAKILKRNEEYNVPLMMWQRQLISNVMSSQRIIDIPFHHYPKTIKFKAGSDLASKVK